MSPQPCELSSSEVFTGVRSSACRHARPKTKTKGQKQRQQKTIDMSISQNYTELHKISLNYTTFIPIRQKSRETAVAIVSLLLFFDCLFDCSDCFYFSCFFNHVTHFPSLTSCSNELVNFMLACCWPISPSSHKNLGARPHRRTLPS